MKLIVENFRCYRDKHSFEFDDDGITLISGHSGAGKTSLLMALFFVITGNSPPKVISDGCDSCRVILETPTFTIHRTKRPNRVVISPMGLEDDIAQQFIYRHFGKYFEITSYIQQQYQRTFLYQSPAEKLEILEKLCFDEGGIQPEELKKNCASALKQLNHQHISLKSRHSTLREVCKTVIEPPIEKIKPDPTRYDTLLKSLDELKSLETQYYSEQSTRDQRKEYLVAQQELLDQLSQLSECPYTERQLNEQIYNLNQLSKMVFEPIWVKYSQEDSETMISDYARDIQYHKEYHDLTLKIQSQLKIEEQIKTLQRKKEQIENTSEGIYECPECDTLLSLMNQQLIKAEKKASSKHLSSSQKKRLTTEIEQSLEQLLPQIKSLEHFRERKVEIESLIDPDEELTALEEDYQWILDYHKTNVSKETEQRLNQERKQQMNETLLDLTEKECVKWIDVHQQRQQLKKKLQFVEQQLSKLSPESPCQIDIQHIKYQQQEIEQQLVTFRADVHAYQVYTMELEQYSKYKQTLAEIQEIEQQLKQLERRMSAAAEFKQMILKTESEVIDQKTLEISKLVNTYSTQIFSDPISVEMKTSKRTSTQNEKVQIQLEVYYKNMKCDVSLLSGGEQARLNLAFVLAFAHVFHSPLLLLDECTSNLDEELVNTVVEQIQYVGIPKVILIAHQIVEGSFKQILRIK